MAKFQSRKLFKILSILEARDWEGLRWFIQNPNRKTKARTSELLEVLYDARDRLSEVSNEDLMQMMAKGMGGGHFDATCTWLTNVIDAYLAYENLSASKAVVQTLKVKELSQRKSAIESFESILKKARSNVETERIHPVSKAQCLFDLEWCRAAFNSVAARRVGRSKGEKKMVYDFAVLHEHVDSLFIVVKAYLLMQEADMNHYLPWGIKKPDHYYFPEIDEAMLQKLPGSVSLLMKIYQFRSSAGSEKLFLEILQLLEKEHARIDPEAVMDLYRPLLSFCYDKINKVLEERKYLQHAVEIIRFLDKHGILDEKMKTTEFTGFVKTFLRAGLIEDARKLYRSYTDGKGKRELIGPKPGEVERIKLFLEGLIAFYAEDFEEALNCFEELYGLKKMADPFQEINFWFYWIMAQIEKTEWSDAEKRIALLRQHVQRTEMSENRRERLRDTLNGLTQLVRANLDAPDKKKGILNRLLKRLEEKDNFLRGDWIRKKAMQMINK